jgi:heavy metal sensor kinase
MKWPTRIRTRLALWYSGILGALLVGFTIGVGYFFLHGLREEFDRNLSENFDRAVRHLETAPDGTIGMRKPERTPQNPARDFATEIPIEVWSTTNELLYQSPAWNLARMEMPTPAASPGLERAIENWKGGNGQRFRVMFAAGSSGGRDVVVRVALNEERVWSEVWELVGLFLVGLPIALLVAGLLGYWMAKKALRPVDNMGKQALAISAESLHERLPVGNPHDELGSLAQVINGLLARLEKSFGELKRFTSDASHELRTPLQALRSLGEVALQGEQPKEHYREIISSMLEETDKLSRLTGSLLTLSRADAGQVKLTRINTPVNDLVQGVNTLLEPLAEEKKQTLQFTSEGSADAAVDPVVLRQAILNLVDNAIKYSPVGTEIRTRLHAPKAGWLGIDVSDEGPGMAKEHQAKIFDRFYRIDKSRSRDFGGTGLGLAITKWAVEAHGGFIDVESELGRGSTFRIQIPISTEEPSLPS